MVVRLSRRAECRRGAREDKSGDRASRRVERNEPGFARVLDQLRSCPSSELLVEPGAMLLDGAKAEAAKPCNLGIGVADRKQAQYLFLFR